MGNVASGSLDGCGLTVAVVASRFNPEVTSRLLQGALEGLRELGVSDEAAPVYSVPGAVEIPPIALALARGGKVDAVVAVGAVIRGETSHYDHVCRLAADGCLQVTMATGVPVAFGVLTCENEAQAMARAAEREANKGWEAARVAVEMARLLRQVRS